MKLPPRVYRYLIRSSVVKNRYVDFIYENYSLEGKEVLDFGCGTGDICSIVDPDRYIGVDISEERIKYAKKKYPDYKFKTIEPGETLPIEDNSKDYLLGMVVLHHISDENIEEILQEFERVLKPGGEAICIEPYYEVPRRKIGNRIRNKIITLLDDGEWMRTKEEYSSLFENTSLDPEVITTYDKLVYKTFFAYKTFIRAKKMNGGK